MTLMHCVCIIAAYSDEDTTYILKSEVFSGERAFYCDCDVYHALVRTPQNYISIELVFYGLYFDISNHIYIIYCISPLGIKTVCVGMQQQHQQNTNNGQIESKSSFKKTVLL